MQYNNKQVIGRWHLMICMAKQKTTIDPNQRANYIIVRYFKRWYISTRLVLCRLKYYGFQCVKNFRYKN